MSGERVRRGLRRAFRVGLFSNGYGFDHSRTSSHEVPQRPIVPFRCETCQGVRRGRRAGYCFGYEEFKHVSAPKLMEVIDSDTAPPDTPGLDVRVSRHAV